MCLQKVMKYILVSILSIFLALTSANAQVRVVDALDNIPVSAASAFDAQGNVVGYTLSNGVLSDIPVSAYPLTLRCMGYEQLVIDTPEEKIWQMVPILFDLPELVVVPKERNVLKQTFYAREYFSITTTSDTINFFTEHMTGRLVPASKGAKFKGDSDMRIYGSRGYANYKLGGEDSTVVKSEMMFPSMLHLLQECDKEITVPESFKADDNQVKIYEEQGKSGVSLIYKQNAYSFTTVEDMMAKKKKHSASLWPLKIFGLTMRVNQLYATHSYIPNDEGIYLPKDLQEASLVIEADVKGLLIRKMLGSDQPMVVRSMVEIYLVDWDYLTQKEADEECDNEKRTDNFIIPSSVPPLNEATRRLVEKATAGANP